MNAMDLIKTIYSKMKYSRLKRLLVCLVILVVLVALFSIILGNPFPHKYFVVVNEFWVEGWLTRYLFLTWGISILSAVLAVNWDVHRVRRLYAPLVNMVHQECNATKLMETSQKGIAFAAQKNLKKEKRALLEFEFLYVFALNALGKFEEAIDYLENDWHSAKKKAYKMYVLQMKLNIAARDENVELYHILYSQAPKMLNKNISFLLQSKVMDGKYAEAISLIEKEQGSSKKSLPIYQIRDMYYKAKCYFKMGEHEKAKSCLEYVIDNGGDLMYKKFAIELFEQIKISEKSC